MKECRCSSNLPVGLFRKIHELFYITNAFFLCCWIFYIYISIFFWSNVVSKLPLDYLQDAAKRPLLFLLWGPKLTFSPRRDDSYRFTWNLAWPWTTWVRLAVQNFTPIGEWGGKAAPKMAKNPLFDKESPRRGESFDRFLQLLGLLIIRPTTLRQGFTFEMIRITTKLLLRNRASIIYPKFSVHPVGKNCVGSKNALIIF